MRVRARRARSDAQHVVMLQRELALCVEAQARAAVAAALAASEAAEAAAKAARALQALQAELRETMRLEIGADYATWHSNGFGGDFVALAEHIATDAERIAGAAGHVENNAACIVESAEVFLALAHDNDDANDDALAENE